MSEVRAKGRLLFILAAVFLAITLFTMITTAQPQGPENIDRGASQRGNTTEPVAIQAQAGNVTALSINATQITRRWQGYFGNISGTIVLTDALNNTLYSWQDISPEGEIYAVNSSQVPVWTDVYCFNFSNNKSAGAQVVQRFNGTDVERTLGMDPDDVDGVDETFNRTFSGSFQVGSLSFGASSGCSVVNLNVNSQYQETDFQEVLLTDNHSVIYTSILEQDQIGFQNTPVDFQMIVGENGDSAEPSTYYFYVELS